MNITRRGLLVSGTLIAGTQPVFKRAEGTFGQRVLIFDSRSALSSRQVTPKAGNCIDVAQAPIGLWKDLQTVSAGATVQAITRWSDFIALRGQL
jgi:hypothetical protein